MAGTILVRQFYQERNGKAKVYEFKRNRHGKYYEHKRVEVIYTLEDEVAITVTVYVFFGKWKEQQ